MSEKIKKELDKLNQCTIVGSCYAPNKVFDTLSLRLEKNGKTLRFDVAFRHLLDLKTAPFKERQKKSRFVTYPNPSKADIEKVREGLQETKEDGK